MPSLRFARPKRRRMLFVIREKRKSKLESRLENRLGRSLSKLESRLNKRLRMLSKSKRPLRRNFKRRKRTKSSRERREKDRSRRGWPNKLMQNKKEMASKRQHLKRLNRKLLLKLPKMSTRRLQQETNVVNLNANPSQLTL